MSILGAVATGAKVVEGVKAGLEGAKAASGLMIKYTKSDYETKITALESHLSSLDTHYSTMIQLRDQFSNFWQDDKGEQVYKNLLGTIDDTSLMMGNVRRYMDTLKELVADLDASDQRISELIDQMSAILSIGEKG